MQDDPSPGPLLEKPTCILALNGAPGPATRSVDPLLCHRATLATAPSPAQPRWRCSAPGSPGLTHSDRGGSASLPTAGGTGHSPQQRFSQEHAHPAPPTLGRLFTSSCRVAGAGGRPASWWVPAQAVWRLARGCLHPCCTGVSDELSRQWFSSPGVCWSHQPQRAHIKPGMGPWHQPVLERGSPKNGQGSRGPRRRQGPDSHHDGKGKAVSISGAAEVQPSGCKGPQGQQSTWGPWPLGHPAQGSAFGAIFLSLSSCREAQGIWELGSVCVPRRGWS